MKVSDAYFATMSQMQAAVSKRDFEAAARLVRDNLRQIPQWVRETCREYGSFDIRSIPALEQGGTVLALVGDDEGIAEMRKTVTSVPELASWIDKVDGHQQDRLLFQAVLEVVRVRANCLQTDVKKFVGEKDGHRVARAVSYLEKAGKIVRLKAGGTYKLLLSG